MALTLLLCVILPLMTTAMKCPNGIQVNMTCYNRSHILDLQGDFLDFGDFIFIYQLGILRKTKTLYYSFEPKWEDPEYNKVGFINLDCPSKFGIISPPKNIPLNFRYFDFDQDNAIIYLGGSDGVYKFNTFNDSLSHFSSRDKTILSLFFNDNVYFVKDNEFEIICEKAGAFESLLKDDRNRAREEYLPKITVKNFVITDDNTVVFISTLGLFAARAEMNSQVYRLSKNAFFDGLAVDSDGEVYTWWVDGIYKVGLVKVNLAKSTVDRVAKISSIGALTFDIDNSILYTTGKALYKLSKPDEEEC